MRDGPQNEKRRILQALKSGDGDDSGSDSDGLDPEHPDTCKICLDAVVEVSSSHWSQNAECLDDSTCLLPFQLALTNIRLTSTLEWALAEAAQVFALENSRAPLEVEEILGRAFYAAAPFMLLRTKVLASKRSGIG